MNKLNALLTGLLGITLVFAFAPFDVFPLATITLAGLLAFLLSATPKRAFTLGFTFGLGLFGAGVYWVYIAIHQYGDVPILLSILIASGLAAILALFPATVCYLTNRYFPVNNTAKLVFAFPSIWILIEWVRSWIAGGFPWLFLGYSQTNSPLKGYAPILSVYGTSLAVIMSSGLLVNATLKFRQKEWRSLYCNLFALITIWTLGAALSLIPWTSPNGKPVTVSLVQGNIPQSLKWSPEHVALSFDRYTSLTKPLWGKSDVIVWPEAAIPMSLQTVNAFIQDMDTKASNHDAELILGIPMQNPKGSGYYNAVVGLGANKSVYLKRRLVPYGEYVPLQQLSSRALNFMNVPMADMIPGEFYQEPLIAGDTRINTSICFEIAFPELINTQDKTIGMLLTVTNDAWFDDSIAKPQHLQMAAMRAIELGRPVLFASNDGITAILDSRGHIVAQAPQHIPFVLNGTVQPMYGVTPWMTNGMDLILAILLCNLLWAAFSNRRMTRLTTTINKQRETNGRTI